MSLIKSIRTTASGSASMSQTGKAWTMSPQLHYLKPPLPATSTSSIQSNHTYHRRNYHFQHYLRTFSFILFGGRDFHSRDATSDPPAPRNSSLSRYRPKPGKVPPQSRQGNNRNIHHLWPHAGPVQDLLEASLILHP